MLVNGPMIELLKLKNLLELRIQCDARRRECELTFIGGIFHF